jgi:hypothetical protein
LHPVKAEATVLTLFALLLGVTVVTPSPAPPDAIAPPPADVVTPAFDAPPPDAPPLARHGSELRDPFAARNVAAPPRPRSDLRDPFAAQSRARARPSNRPADLKAPF